MSTQTEQRRKRSRADLVHLRSLPATQPSTKIGQVDWAWAEIQAGLAAGMKLKEIWEAANRGRTRDVVFAIPRLPVQVGCGGACDSLGRLRRNRRR